MGDRIKHLETLGQRERLSNKLGRIGNTEAGQLVDIVAESQMKLKALHKKLQVEYRRNERETQNKLIL